MRNLKLQYCKEQKTGIPCCNQILLQPDFERSGQETTYIVTDSKIYAVDNNAIAFREPKLVAALPDIVGAEYLQLDNAICLATGAGEVLLIEPDTLSQREGTYCDVGIECMSWSPNQEVVAFITRTKNVVVMTCTYDVLAEQPLDASLSDDQQFVNVGWGKKETQFHGSAGKQAAKQSAEFVAPSNVDQLPQVSDKLRYVYTNILYSRIIFGKQEVQIAWRGDGSYFAVSYVAANVGRTFSVYDSEGKLQYAAEKWNGLQPPIAWRPSGNWIAQPQIMSGKSTVALFEKNGLRHREFDLPFDLTVEPIVHLAWSNDSDILALHTKTTEKQSIYLYTIGNYHWYLKQVLIFEEQYDPLALFHWDNRLGAEHTLHILLLSGKHYTHRFRFGIDCQPSTDIVYVIDGKRLLLTKFSKAVIPPPMAWGVVKLKSDINAVITSENKIYLYTSDHCIYSYQPNSGRIELNCQLSQPSLEMQLTNLSCFGNEFFLAINSADNETQILLLLKGKVKTSLSIPGIVNALTVPDNSKDRCYIQTLENNQIHQVILTPNGELKILRNHLQLSSPVNYMMMHTTASNPAGKLYNFLR